MTDDKELVALTQREPEKGFRLLMAKYKSPVYWHVRRLVVSHDDAQDATQETFVRVFRSLRQFKGECSLRSWIYRISTNEALRIIGQRQHCNVSLDETLTEADKLMADEYVDYSDVEALRLQQAILSLPGRQQLVFNMRYYDEMDYEEIAKVMESNVNNAKSTYHIAKEKIIKYMQLNNH